MPDNDVERSLDRFEKRQRLWWSVFGLVLISVLIGVFVLLHYSTRQAKEEQKQADQKHVTTHAEVLAQIQTLDSKAAELTSPDNPLVFIWKTGVDHPNPAVGITPELINLVNQRRYLIGSIGPSTNSPDSSQSLDDYICSHAWFVVGKSVPTAGSQEWLQKQIAKDPRFGVAALAGGPINPNSLALIVGFFLDQNTAQKLSQEIDKSDHSKPFARRWDFPNCAATGRA